MKTVTYICDFCGVISIGYPIPAAWTEFLNTHACGSEICQFQQDRLVTMAHVYFP